MKNNILIGVRSYDRGKKERELGIWLHWVKIDSVSIILRDVIS